MRWVADKTV